MVNYCYVKLGACLLQLKKEGDELASVPCCENWQSICVHPCSMIT